MFARQMQGVHVDWLSVRFMFPDEPSCNDLHGYHEGSCRYGGLNLMTQGYKLLITYDYLPDHEMAYRRFMMTQWLPAMQQLKLEPLAIFHTQWGHYPVRQLALYAENEAIIRQALNDEKWGYWWERLSHYVVHQRYCVLPAREWCQFCAEV
jgi:hypothetical protein